MIRLTHSDWQKINRLALDIHAANSRHKLVRLAIEDLPGILEAGYACWNEHSAAMNINAIETTASHHGTILGLLPTIDRLAASHPVVLGCSLVESAEVQTGVFNLTDFVSAGRLRDVPIWQDVYRKVEARHQFFTQFFLQRDHGVILTVNSDRPFSEEQRAMLEVVRDHFHVACRRHCARESLMQRLSRVPGAESLVRLSRREREVLPWLLRGGTNPEIGTILGISSRTVEKHVARILGLAGVENRRALMALLLDESDPGEENG